MTAAPARDLERRHLESHAQQFARRMRVRVGMGSSGVLTLVGLLFAIQGALTGRWMFAALDLFSAALAVLCLYLFRHRRSPTLPSALLLGWMLLVPLHSGFDRLPERS